MLVGWSGSTFAASPDQAPPLAAGIAHIWFVRQLIPGSTFYAPTILVNGANVAISPEGTAFYRDYAPGIYKFTMEPVAKLWRTLFRNWLDGKLRPEHTNVADPDTSAFD